MLNIKLIRDLIEQALSEGKNFKNGIPEIENIYDDNFQWVKENAINTDLRLTELETSGTPVGTIISYMGTTAPKNYLFCDGSELNISDYPKLAKHFEDNFGSKNHFGGNGTTTFAVPNLCGEFLRGTGTNGHSGDGNGADVGEHQNGTLIPMFYGYNYGIQVANGNSGVSYYDKGIGTATHSISNSDADWYGNSSGQATRFTTRPTNTSVMYCIKY